MGRQSRRGRGDRGRGGYHKKKSPTQDIKEKYYKFKPHGQGKDKQNVFYGKIVDKILMKIEATYEHGADITWSIENKQKFDFDEGFLDEAFHRVARVQYREEYPVSG